MTSVSWKPYSKLVLSICTGNKGRLIWIKILGIWVSIFHRYLCGKIYSIFTAFKSHSIKPQQYEISFNLIRCNSKTIISPRQFYQIWYSCIDHIIKNLPIIMWPKNILVAIVLLLKESRKGSHTIYDIFTFILTVSKYIAMYHQNSSYIHPY